MNRFMVVSQSDGIAAVADWLGGFRRPALPSVATKLFPNRPNLAVTVVS
jgi:hypothetical protein